MTKTFSKKSNQSGNILVYILGAILLMGLLIIMVKGSSTPGSGIDKEALLIRVSEVQNYGQELERAVAYIMRNGHSEADIRFAYPGAASAYGDITSDPTRQVFATAGGGATYREPPTDIQIAPADWIFTSGNTVLNVGSHCASAECMDLIAILPNVSKEFCVRINDKAGVVNIAGDPPEDSGTSSTGNLYVGTFVYGNIIADTAQYLSGKTEACYESTSNPPAGYYYYRVLYAR